MCGRSPGILPLLSHACGEQWLAAIKLSRLAGVVPDVNLRECTSHIPPPRMNKAAHSGFESQRRCHQKSKLGISGPIKGHVSTKKIIKKEKDGTWLVKFDSLDVWIISYYVHGRTFFFISL